MMRITMPEAFLLYVAVPLAVLLWVWLSFSARRGAWRRSARRTVVCRFCGERVTISPDRQEFRCPSCSAEQRVFAQEYHE
ncbi:hypothetical protein MAMC_01869 [Methylacidimicrobium cyclopophantes]|uniref:Hydrogenase nickel incorporation protein HypA n=1 Tax=Methylacidimicrobium cyclopophantes TaxID=1041766 RepID=A0A5E6MHR5_9BACT|nr:hypothetical protein [Methylacidimicrobium cyclopophantes]VVM07857.1 hypothetical protein MAMC_01869 [Methylacidimicrobium cyclopophantes]